MAFNAVTRAGQSIREAMADAERKRIDDEAGAAAKQAGIVTPAEDPNTIQDYRSAAQGIQVGTAGDEGMTPEERAAASNAYALAAQAGTKYYLGRGNGNNGQAFDTAPTPQDQRLAAIRAMGTSYAGAGEHEKALRLHSAADSAELTGMQIDTAKRDQEYEKGKREVFLTTPVAMALKEGKEPTPGQQLQTAARLFYHDAQSGKATATGMMEIAGKMQSIETENYAKAVQALHSGASKDTILKIFNASGTKINPATLSDPKPVEVDIGGGQKVKTYEITYTDPSGQVVTLNGRRELDALGKGTESFNQAVALANLKNDTTKAGAAVTSAGAAATSAAASARLHGIQADAAQLEQAGSVGAAKLAKDPNAVLTPAEQAGVQFVTGKSQLLKGSPENQNKAFDQLESRVKDYLKIGDTQMTQFDPKEVARRQAVYVRSLELGRAAISQNRNIDPAPIIKQAESDVKRASIVGSGTGSTASTGTAAGAQKKDFSGLW